jgi:RNA polymerase sigma-70 factor (ECF subfamily)
LHSILTPLIRENFKQQYFLYFEDLCRFAHFYCSDEQLAKDSVQQVFLKLWENQTDFRSISNPKSYLFTAVKNQVLNESRKKDVMKRLENEDISDDYSVEDRLAGKDLKDKIQTLVNLLPAKRQYIFKLSREEDKSYKEIAELMEIAPKTVENQIGKALKFLRDKMYDSENE